MRRLVIVPSKDSGFGDQTSLSPSLRRSMLSESDAAFLTAIIDRITLSLGPDQPREIVLDERIGGRTVRREAVNMLQEHLRTLIASGEIEHDLGLDYEGRDALLPSTPRAVAAINLLATIRAGTSIASCPQCTATFTPGNRADVAKFCSNNCKITWNNARKLAT